MKRGTSPPKNEAAGPGQQGTAAETTNNKHRANDSTTESSGTSRPRDPRNGRIKYVRLWITEMAGRTASLSPAANGAYWRIFQHHIATQTPLPDDRKLICRITGVAPAEWPNLREELLVILDLVDGCFRDEYAEKCIAEFRAASTRNRRNVSARYQVKDGVGGAA